MSAIVLAAGQGTRMHSVRPKPLHRLVGRPMIRHVLDALGSVSAARIVVVVGNGADELVAQLPSDVGGVTVDTVEQPEQLGTGDAVRVALSALPDADDIVVVPGDTPLLRPASVSAMLEVHRASDAVATALTARVADPTGYGRILRDVAGGVTGVVEHADASDDQRGIDEINTSIYCFRRGSLDAALDRIRPDNAQGEWYLTDVIGVLHADGERVGAFVLDDPGEAQGVNDRVQLAAAEAVLRRRIGEEWMRAGVTIVDPSGTYIDADVHLARDVTLFPGAVLRGATVVGEGCEIGPNAYLADAVVGSGAVVGASAVLECGAAVAPGGRVAALTRLVGDRRQAPG